MFFREEESGGTSSILQAGKSPSPRSQNPRPWPRRQKSSGAGNWKLGFTISANAREQRIRPLKEIIDEYLVGYRLRNRAPRFANYALGHVKRIVGNRLTVDTDAAAVRTYQEDRLREGASPKSVNEEVRFLLKMLGDPGEIVRAQLRKEKQLKLKVRTTIGKAFDSSETDKLSSEVEKSRSPHIYMAFMLARNAGLRDTEIKTLIISDQLEIRDYRLSTTRLEPGERADGVVIFDRPNFKQSTEKLFLQIAQADQVDQPVLIRIPFTPPIAADIK
ncbi:MAG TPA: hypothetical protein VL991_01010 [Terracidiphilus sp.]|nr:hypothetical protein [Terracidiphilus sp.]